MYFTTTHRRNELVLNYKGYQYTKKQAYVHSNEWRHRARPCTTSLSVRRSDNSILREPTVHSCVLLPSLHKIAVDEFVSCFLFTDTELSIQSLVPCNQWHSDGTFKNKFFLSHMQC